MFEYRVNQNGEVIITGYTGNDIEVIIPPEIEGKPVKSIGMYAFLAHSRLTSVTIPDSVKSIGDAAFEGCRNLTYVKIPESVTDIGKRAFYGCRRLTSITIPESTKNIMKYAFCGCYSLEDVWYAGTEKQWEQIEIGSYNHALSKAKKHFKNA